MTAKRQGRGGRVVTLTILGLILLLGGAYAGAYAFAADRVPRGTTVAGIEIGGVSPANARTLVSEAFEGRGAVTATVAGTTEKLSVADLGFTFDLEETIAEAGAGRSWKPERLWDYYAGGEEIAPVIDVDDAKFDAALDALDAKHGQKAREGDITFAGGKVNQVPGRTGQGIDRDAARAALLAAYADDETAQLNLVATEPEVTAAEVEAAARELAPVVSGPVTLVFSNSPVEFAPRAFARALSAREKDGALELVVDEKLLDRIVRSKLGDAGKPVDATVELVGGTPVVRPSKPGVDYKRRDVVRAFEEAISHSVAKLRTQKVKASVAQPEVTTAEARKWGIKEKVSTFTTYYPHTDYRNINIPRALELIDGTVLAPGDTFSLNGTVGERTASNGFVKGFVIDGGEITTAYGGGVSQVATTTFNAAFFAGLKDIEHKPHSLYFSRYPVGREATVAWPYVDLKFQNDTPYGVLIDTSVQRSSPGASGVVTVSMWSTKYWDIDAETGDRYNIGTPGHRVDTSADCEPQEANTGFDIDIWRIFRRHGSSEVVRREKMHTHYNTADAVTCKAPEPKPTTSPKPSPSPTNR